MIGLIGMWLFLTIPLPSTTQPSPLSHLAAIVARTHLIGLFSARAKDSPTTRAAALLDITYTNSVQVERPSQRAALL